MLDNVESLDEVALTIEHEVAIAFDPAICFGWDDLDRVRCRTLDEMIGIVSLVGEEGLGRDKPH